MPERLGNALAQDPRKSRPGSHNRLQAIALKRAARALTGTGGMRYQTGGLGPVAQRSEQGAHNALVGGSSPSGPTIAETTANPFGIQ